MSFFKTADPAVLAAITKYTKEINQVRDKGHAFRDLFLASDAIFQYTIDENRFYGLVFDPPKDSRFWTKPDKKSQTQNPRSKVPKMTAEEKHWHRQLLSQWNGAYPKKRVSKNGVFVSLGTDFGEVFLCGLVFFELNGFVYVDTEITLGSNVTEIVGSEYKAAKVAYQDTAKKEVQS